MKIFVFSTHALWQPHMETELEIIHSEANEILSIIVASLKTARNNANQKS